MIIKIENKIYLLDINSVGKKILNSNKVKIISLFIFITLTSIDVLNFLNLGHQNKIMSENKKAIVVLTGGSKRLEEGFQLLQKKNRKCPFYFRSESNSHKKRLKNNSK